MTGNDEALLLNILGGWTDFHIKFEALPDAIKDAKDFESLRKVLFESAKSLSETFEQIDYAMTDWYYDNGRRTGKGYLDSEKERKDD